MWVKVAIRVQPLNEKFKTECLGCTLIHFRLLRPFLEQSTKNIRFKYVLIIRRNVELCHV